ncbi:MAG: pyridoxamine 5'-phosphate oxidase family protein [Actinomycetales bacterium]
MASWDEFAREAPGLCDAISPIVTRRRHHALATLRADGSPRLSGSEVEIRDGWLYLGSMPGARKAMDLRRDPRLSLLALSDDPAQDDASSWAGDVRISGRAVEEAAPDSHSFRVDITEVVHTRVAGDRLLITTWSPSTGTREFSRA